MFSNLEMEASHLGRLFFLIFVCVMLFVMTNMLISILNDAMEEVIGYYSHILYFIFPLDVSSVIAIAIVKFR